MHWNSSALKPSMVRFGRVLPYWQDWKAVKLMSPMTAWIKLVCQKKLNCGFSTQKRQSVSTAHWISLAVRWYSLLAFEIFMRSTKLRKGNPFGYWFDRSGRGGSGSPGFLRLIGMDRALEALPQGGARKMPTTRGFASHCINNSTPGPVVKSASTKGATALLWRTWSVPNELKRPNCFKAAVTLPVPANTSIIKHSFRPTPASTKELMRPLACHFFFWSWSFSAWGAWHPFLLQRCHPRGHSPPSGASLHFAIW